MDHEPAVRPLDHEAPAKGVRTPRWLPPIAIALIGIALGYFVGATQSGTVTEVSTTIAIEPQPLAGDDSAEHNPDPAVATPTTSPPTTSSPEPDPPPPQTLAELVPGFHDTIVFFGQQGFGRWTPTVSRPATREIGATSLEFAAWDASGAYVAYLNRQAQGGSQLYAGSFGSASPVWLDSRSLMWHQTQSRRLAWIGDDPVGGGRHIFTATVGPRGASEVEAIIELITPGEALDDDAVWRRLAGYGEWGLLVEEYRDEEVTESEEHRVSVYSPEGALLAERTDVIVWRVMREGVVLGTLDAAGPNADARLVGFDLQTPLLEGLSFDAAWSLQLAPDGVTYASIANNGEGVSVVTATSERVYDLRGFPTGWDSSGRFLLVHGEAGGAWLIDVATGLVREIDLPSWAWGVELRP